jgi:hypothetical protein
VREAIEASGATLLYLPQYSPDLDPIELAFGPVRLGLGSAQAAWLVEGKDFPKESVYREGVR